VWDTLNSFTSTACAGQAHGSNWRNDMILTTTEIVDRFKSGTLDFDTALFRLLMLGYAEREVHEMLQPKRSAKKPKINGKDV
jgi:hypothetical protein